MTLEEMILKKRLKYILFGGKGGVGKTTAAAACSVWAAQQGRETLIISTDPAHSLSDSLAQDLSGGDIKEVRGVPDLYGLEVNPQKEFSKYQKSLESASDSSEIAGIPGSELLEDLGGLTPPGADEALAFAKVLEFIEKSEHDLIIFDTAPTGHTLRLLSLPDLLNSFFGKLLTFRLRLSRVWGRIKRLFGRGEEEEDRTLETLERLKTTIDAAGKELKDETKTNFVIVMIPELMAIYETERLLSALYEYEIPASFILVNMVYPDIPDCWFCKSRKSMQDKHLKEIRELYDEFTIIEIPLAETEIRGIEGLERIGKILFI
ncbi:MAG: ArsA family ATPase [Promethearchaeota archaeon]